MNRIQTTIEGKDNDFLVEYAEKNNIKSVSAAAKEILSKYFEEKSLGEELPKKEPSKTEVRALEEKLELLAKVFIKKLTAIELISFQILSCVYDHEKIHVPGKPKNPESFLEMMSEYLCDSYGEKTKELEKKYDEMASTFKLFVS